MSGFMIATKAGYRRTYLRKGDEIIFDTSYAAGYLIITFWRDLCKLLDGRRLTQTGIIRPAEITVTGVWNIDDLVREHVKVALFILLQTGLGLDIISNRDFDTPDEPRSISRFKLVKVIRE